MHPATKVLRWGKLLLMALLMVGCGGSPSLPSSFSEADAKPDIFPDYTDVTVPSNIAPLNFMMEDADEIVAHITAGSLQHNYGEGNKVVIDQQEWKEMLSASQGGKMTVDVYRRKGGEWTKFKPFSICVASDSIDPFISYRELPPTYVGFEQLAIRQRNITTFEETDIFNTRLITTEKEGVCINCHTCQNFNPRNMMFHVRISHPGTIIATDGELRKVNIKLPDMVTGAVYSSWHPTEKIITFNTANTTQSFHTRELAKVEVVESKSDMYMYDVESNTISPILTDSMELELFPTWSPDGKWLYYSDAHIDFSAYTDDPNPALTHYQELKYNVFRLSYEPGTRTFGSPELVYDAASKGRSAVEVRISPGNPRYMVFAEGPNGLFHIWHPSADIQVMDTKTGQLMDTKAMNSSRAESYPSFSSTGRWILFESRRDDGNYTRTYIAYFDRNGKAHKPFMVPQEDPEFFHLLLMSWSRPEFMTEPMSISPQRILDKVREDAIQAKGE